MQVEGIGSGISKSSNRTRKNKDGRREGKRYIGLANSERS